MPDLRSKLKDTPWLGWAFAAVCLVLAGFMFWRNAKPADMTSPERMTEMLTIKYADTGEVEEIPRGRLDKMLRTQDGLLDPGKGIVNPKTGQPTGFLFNKNDWNEMVERINADKKAAGVKEPPEAPVSPKK